MQNWFKLCCIYNKSNVSDSEYNFTPVCYQGFYEVSEQFELPHATGWLLSIEATQPWSGGRVVGTGERKSQIDPVVIEMVLLVWLDLRFAVT